MLKLENIEVFGWEAAIRGMRNPMNSWAKSDTTFFDEDGKSYMLGGDTGPAPICYDGAPNDFIIGEKDLELMTALACQGPVHGKFRRMIIVTVDITAPLYWWKEFDTYKVGTVANSCSTMHKIHAEPIDESAFSFDHVKLCEVGKQYLEELERLRQKFNVTGKKGYWYALIQLLPEGYNQRRTVMVNYEVLANIYQHRRNHKLDEWHIFCDWIEELPYSEVIFGGPPCRF